MSSSQDNNIFRKTSFLAGSNSAFIEELYADYLKNPSTLPEDWKEFFDGLKEKKEVIFKTLEGPSWAPIKKNKKKDKLDIEGLLEKESVTENNIIDSHLGEEAAKNSNLPDDTIKGDNGSTPKDIPDIATDDTTAKQLRAEAEGTNDPELKALYWDAYRQYKGIKTKN